MQVRSPRKLLALGLAPIFGVALAACGVDTGGPSGITVSIVPPAATVKVGRSQKFNAEVTGTTNVAVTWSVLEGASGGTITSQGTYTAPDQPGTYHVAATSLGDPSQSATATVTVQLEDVVSVTISPEAASVPVGGAQTFSANTVVSWSVEEGAAGGAITGEGVYTAPNTVGTFHVRATSLVDPTVYAQVNVSVGGQKAGTLDDTFGLSQGIVVTDFGGTDLANAMAVQPDGKIVVAGYTTVNGDKDFALARYHPDGSPDAGFGTDGKVTISFGPPSSDDLVYAVALQRDGRIVVAGSSTLLLASGSTGTGGSDFALARYYPDGSLDGSFGAGGKVTTDFNGGDDVAYALAIEEDGKIVAVGYASNGVNTDFALARYSADGSLDPSFDTDGRVTTAIGAGDDGARAVALQQTLQNSGPVVRIVVAGSAAGQAGGLDFALARYHLDGSLDTGFGASGIVSTDFGTGQSAVQDTAYALALQFDGKIVLAGSSNRNGGEDFAVARYTAGGSLDTGFDTDGKVTTTVSAGEDLARGVAVQVDGKIVAAGFSTDSGGNQHFALARYLSDGGLDADFGPGGTAITAVSPGGDAAYALALQPDGRIVAAGTAMGPNGNFDFALVRYNVDYTFDSSPAAGGAFFTTSVAPTVQSVLPDSSADFTVIVQSRNGFAGKVTLSCAVIPVAPSITCDFSSNPLVVSQNGWQRSSLAVRTTTATPAGTYTLKVVGTGPSGETASPSVLLKVIRPDLAMSGVTIGAIWVKAGSTLSISDTVQNVGNAAAGPFTIRYVLSSDTTFGPEDVAITETRTVALLAAAGASNSATTAVTVPAATQAGRYYLCARADPVVYESETKNNALCGTSTITVGGPDLIPSILNVQSSGTNLMISHAVKNQGNVNAEAFDIGFYLSTDLVFSPATDILICSRTVSSLKAGASDPATGTMSTTCAVPTTAAPGPYYVFVVADSGNTVDESNESNNATNSSSTMAIGPDLIVTALTATISGTDLVINDTVRNQGNLDAGTFTISYYLSTDTGYNPGDILICSRVLPSLAAGSSSPGGPSPCSFAAAPAAFYYVVAVADSGGAVTESNEGNNTLPTKSSLGIGPDLILTSLTVAVLSSDLVITEAVNNQGNLEAGAFTVSFHLSQGTVNTLTTCARTVTLLPAGASDPATGPVPTTCPLPTVAVGAYQVVAVADSGGAVTESDETNNTRSVPLKIGPDLVMTQVAPGSTWVDAGSTLSVTDTVANQGTLSAGAFEIRYRLSLDNVYNDPGDRLLTPDRPVSTLAAGSPDTATTSLAVPLDVLQGNYYVCAKADAADSINETNADNNTRCSDAPILVSPPDLVIDAVSGPASAKAGTTIYLSSAVVRNQGAGNASAFYVGFYLSQDATIDPATDTWVGDYYISGGLAPKTSKSMIPSNPLTIPAGLAPGTYYLGAYADYQQSGPFSVAEGLEDNNGRAGNQITIGP